VREGREGKRGAKLILEEKKELRITPCGTPEEGATSRGGKKEKREKRGPILLGNLLGAIIGASRLLAGGTKILSEKKGTGCAS